MRQFQRTLVRTFSEPTDTMLVHVQFGFVLGVLFSVLIMLIFFRFGGL